MSLVRSVAFRYGRWSRRRKARFAIALGDRVGAGSILLVGVSGAQNPVNNLVELALERRFPHVVASGIELAHGWEAFVVADGRQLPFGDGSFDLVYANAVIEHVGDASEQQRFVREVSRVGRSWVITTPNRWFPIEAHYHSFFSHWRRSWTRGDVTRLLGRRDLRTMLPPGGRVTGVPVLSPTLTAYRSEPCPPTTS
jgi:hypothetical protein